MDQVLQWNCRSVSSNITDLISLINQHEPFAVAVSESWLKPGQNFRVRGYSVLRDDRADGCGGAALLIKKNFLFTALSLPSFSNSHLNAVAAKIGDITILSIYISCKDSTVIPVLKNIILSLPSPIMVLGDFNAHHSLWGAPNNDSIGYDIVELLDDVNLCVLNDGSPTRRGRPGQNPSFVDLSLCSASLSSCLTWRRLPLTFGSDHHPIVIYLPKNDRSVDGLPPLLKYNLHNCDWTSFKLMVEEKVKVLPSLTQDNLLASFDSFLNAIQTSADAVFKLKNVANNKIPSPPWWDHECTAAIKKRKEAEKQCRDSLTMQNYLCYKNVSSASKRLLKRKKKEGWQRFCSSLSPDTPSTVVWNNIKRYRCSLTTNNPKSYTLDWVNTFVNKLAPDYVPNFNQIPTVTDDDETTCESNSGELNSPFSLKELKLVLSRVSDSCPGQDGIPYSFIAHLSPFTLTFLLEIINLIVRTGTIPPSWKLHIVIPILKPSKNPSDPSSYRPIAMSSVFSKITEHLIKNRLEWHLERNNLLGSSQFGFRKGKSTSDNLSIFSADLLLAFSENKSVTAAFLDIESAYDNVDLLSLKQELNNLKIPRIMSQFIFNLFTERFIQLRVPGVNITRRLFKGVPQGSVLSPLLYDIYTRNLETAIPSTCSILQYADDVLLYSIHDSIETASSRLEESLCNLYNWLVNHNLALSISKSTAVIFSRKRVRPDVLIAVDGSQLRIVDEVVFLGRKFDSKCNGLAHTKYIVDKCEKNLNIMRALAGVWWGAHPFTLKLVYNALIRSLLDYGAYVLGVANKEAIKKLDLLQYRCLRVVLGAMRSTPTNALQVESADPPLHLRRQYLSDRFLFKLFQYENHPLIDKLRQLNIIITNNNRFWRNKPIPHLINSYRKFLELDCQLVKFPSHPLFHFDFEVLTFEPDILLSIGIDKDTRYPNLNLLNYIKQYAPISEIFFTDASKATSDQSLTFNSGNPVGSAFLQQSSGYFKLFKYPSLVSNFSGEGLAILECIRYILCNKISHSFIFTDSLSFLQSLLANPFDKNKLSPLSLVVKSKLLECRHNNLQVKLAWIPGHSGIQGNELVDGLAKLAARQGNDSCNTVYCQDLSTVPHALLAQDWNQTWQSSAQFKGKFYHEFQPNIAMKPWFAKLRLPKQISSIISRLRFGHCSSPSHLAKLHILNSAICECGLEDGNIEHILFKCPLYSSLPLYNILVKNKAPLPCNISSLLSLTNKKYIYSLVTFLKYHKLKL